MESVPAGTPKSTTEARGDTEESRGNKNQDSSVCAKVVYKRQQVWSIYLKGGLSDVENVFVGPAAERSRSLRSYLAAQPIHAKNGREWGPESAAKFTDLSGWQL